MEAENALPFANKSDAETLQALINADSLDELHLILAEACGNEVEADRLRRWIGSQAVRQQTRSGLQTPRLT